MKKNKILMFILCGMIAGGLMVPVNASEDTTKKEEVIYANLKDNGDLDKCYVVNIMYPEDRTIVDYGNYSSVKNLTTTDELTYKNHRVSASTKSDKLYYQGYLKNAEIPWNIDISYQLDGRDISAKELAGKSGKLKIKVNVKENNQCQEGFFDNYAMQITVLLDTNLCSNIIATGATTANVGSNKQLIYTILPGKSKNIEVSADVVNFTMDAMTFNGVRLDLGLNLDELDTSSINNQIHQIQTAVASLNDGSYKLNNGASSLNSGAQDLVEGMKTLQAGLDTLNSQSRTLNQGSSEVKEALMTINQALQQVNMNTDDLQLLSSSSTQINQGIQSLVNGLSQINNGISQYEQALGGSISTIKDTTDTTIQQLKAMAQSAKQTGDIQSAQLYENLIQLLSAGSASEDILMQIQAQLSQNPSQQNLMSGAMTLQAQYQVFDSKIQELVTSLNTLVSNINQLKSGIQLLLDHYDQVNQGVNAYTQGVEQVVNGYMQLYKGALTLAGGTQDLYTGTQSMVEGTEKFVSETSHMDNQVNDSIDTMISHLTASDYQTVSFVSKDNKDVKSVQFVIKTPSIEKNEEKVQEKKEEKTLWDKILEFFHIQ